MLLCTMKLILYYERKEYIERLQNTKHTHGVSAKWEAYKKINRCRRVYSVYPIKHPTEECISEDEEWRGNCRGLVKKKARRKV